jgi:hypothetical protein
LGLFAFFEPDHLGSYRQIQAEPSSNRRGKSGEFVLPLFCTWITPVSPAPAVEPVNGATLISGDLWMEDASQGAGLYREGAPTDAEAVCLAEILSSSAGVGPAHTRNAIESDRSSLSVLNPKRPHFRDPSPENCSEVTPWGFGG